ncbi:MAG: peptidoglycan DD-metalloendopeptidase family protein [Marinibacterium sp.]
MSHYGSNPLARLAVPGILIAAVAGCSEPLDMDLRGNLGGFSTAPAAQGVSARRPAPDDRGVISYASYQVVVAKKGESVASIAARLGFSADELSRFNGIDPGTPLRGGEIVALPGPIPASVDAPATPGGVDIQALASAAIDASPDTPAVETEPLPAARPAGPEPVRHKVVRGETAYTISRLYNVPVQSLAEWNGLGPDFGIREGQYLLIPVPRSAPPKGAAAAEVTPAVAVTAPGDGSPTPTPPSASKPLPEEISTASVEAPDVTAEPQTLPPPEGELAYPLQGKIIRAYAKGKSEGIDISASAGSSVSAAGDGTVAAITEDADKIPIVVLRHDNNLLTVYANVSDIQVAKGQSVKRGQKIAQLRSGDDAYVHFEVREGFDSVDPMNYLE